MRWTVPVLAVALALAPVPFQASGGGHSHSSSSKAKTSKKCATCPRDSHGKIKRSAKAKDAFRKAQPCPTRPGPGQHAALLGYRLPRPHRRRPPCSHP
jgi:hypothetical protein